MSMPTEQDVQNAIADIVAGRFSANLSQSMTFELVSRLVNITFLNDNTLQFLPLGVSPILLSGPHAGTTVLLAMTDGDGTTDTLNSLSTVVVTATGGTAPKLNGVTGPLTLTLLDGIGTIILSDTAPGSVTLSLSNPTHPLKSGSLISVTSTADVTLS